MEEFKKYQKAQIKKPLLSATTEEEKEDEVIKRAEGIPLNALNRNVTRSNERLRRFLNTIGLNLEELSEFVSEQGEDPEAFIQSLQQLFDHEKSCTSGFKWAALDHFVEKYLQWPFLSKSDLSSGSKCCTARVKTAQRSILLKSLSGLIKAYGVRSFVKGAQLTLSRTVRYFIYSMVTYRMLTWYQTGRLEFQEFRQIFDKNTEKGIDTLVRELSKKPPLYLNLILNSPLIIAGLYALNGIRGAKAVGPEAMEKTISDLMAQLEPIPAEERDYPAAPIAAQSKSSRNCFKNTFQEFFPPFSWFATTTKLQKLEKLIRWDGRISPEERLQLFDALRQTAQKSHQLTQLHAMECLAKIAHGIGLKDLRKLKEADYNPETIRAVIYTKTLALRTISELTTSNPDHPILALPRRFYATYLLWWLGLSTSYSKQKIPFGIFKAVKTALEISFLYEITKSIVTAIDCPDKPGYKFAEGFADWASDYTAECFSTRLSLFRSVDSNESIEELMVEMPKYHLADLLELGLQHLNSTELYQVIQSIAEKAPNIQKISIFNSPSDTLMLGTFESLSQLKILVFNFNKFVTLPVGIFDRLSQLEILELEYNQLETLPAGVFDGLNQLKTLELEENRLKDLSFGVFNGLNHLQILFLEGNQLTALPPGIFGELRQLKILDLYDNKLEVLPDYIFSELSQLTELYVENNPLTILPISLFQMLHQLEGLGLSELMITNAILNRSTHLKFLALSELTNFSANLIKELGQLEALYLHNIQWVEMPDNIFYKLNRLELLGLSLNQLTTLPDGIFRGLNQLQIIYLYRNRLTALPDSIFRGLDQLRILDLEYNQLVILSEGIFKELYELEELWLGKNKLTTLPTGIFRDLNKLKSLHLADNELNDEAIINLTQWFPYQLEYLDVSRNFISNKGLEELMNFLPCSNIKTFSFFPSKLSLNDSSLLIKTQRKLLEKVCSDRLCHAYLPPAVSCPAHLFSSSIDAAADAPASALRKNNTWLYALPTPLTWIGAADYSLPTLSSCSQASNHVVIRVGESALVIGSVGLGVLFYKNCTVLQSFVTTTQNFVIRCVYGKEQKPSADSIESPSSSTPAAALKTPPQKSSICNLFGVFFKPAANPPRNFGVQVGSQQTQAMQL